MVKFRKGPPEAVMSKRDTSCGFSPIRHWKMALCSESTGRIGAWLSMARRCMICPATTSVSLFANAMVLCALIAAMVGSSPA